MLFLLIQICNLVNTCELNVALKLAISHVENQCRQLIKCVIVIITWRYLNSNTAIELLLLTLYLVGETAYYLWCTMGFMRTKGTMTWLGLLDPKSEIHVGKMKNSPLGWLVWGTKVTGSDNNPVSVIKYQHGALSVWSACWVWRKWWGLLTCLSQVLSYIFPDMYKIHVVLFSIP